MSNLLQLMSKMVTRLKSIEKKVTQSVDELDQIKASIKSVTQKVSTVERQVPTLKQQYKNSGCRKKQPNISISSPFDFFKTFNETPHNIDNDHDLLDMEPHFINTPINAEITADDI